MSTVIKAKKKEVNDVLQIAFPDYTGRTFRVEYCTSVCFHDTNWGGGTHNDYVAVRMSTGKAGRLVAPAPWVNAIEGQRVELPEDVVIVEHSIFCGRDLGIRFYVHESKAPRFLAGGF